MTLQHLHEIALKQFALRGYEGATLETIAREVGIKKQSVYGYCKSKEQLFVQVFKSSVDKEIEFLDQLFRSYAESGPEPVLLELIKQYKKRYDESYTLRLIMYAGFIFPANLKETIGSMISEYVEKKRRYVYEVFNRSAEAGLRVDARQATEAFMNLVEGMLVELIYEGARFEERLQASWDIFWNGVRGPGI